MRSRLDQGDRATSNPLGCRARSTTKPLPGKLRNLADFIIDGSTLDNVLDPAMAIRNFAAMTVNMYSNHYEPYAILPPLWYPDFFVVNKFYRLQSLYRHRADERCTPHDQKAAQRVYHRCGLSPGSGEEGVGVHRSWHIENYRRRRIGYQVSALGAFRAVDCRSIEFDLS
jgi:hypothetical protein